MRIGFSIIFFGLTIASAAAALPLAVGGRLTDGSGAPVAGPVELKLRFYDAATDGHELGEVDDQSVALADGVFQAPVMLDAAAIQAVFGTSGAVFVEVTDVTHGKIYPRQGFNAVPFALRVPVDGTTIKFDNNGALTVPAAPAPPAADAGHTGYLATSDWIQFNGAPQKSYVDGLTAAQVAGLAALSTSLVATNGSVTTLGNAALKKDGSVPLSGGLNAGGQDISNVGNLTMLGSKSFGLSVATSDPAGLGAADVGRIWYNGGIRLWSGASAQSLGISGAGVQSLNGINQNAQSLANGSTGTAPTWASAGSTHTLNIPNASGGGVTAGLISNAEWVVFNGKQNVLPAANAVTNGYLAGADWTVFNAKQPLLASAGFTASGYLASGDWAAFNAKQPAGNYQPAGSYEPALTAGISAQYYRGDKSWQALASGAVAESTNLYYTTARATGDARAAVSAGAPLAYSAATGVLSLAPAAVGANGYLASADWALFNAKQNASGTASAGAAGFLSSSDWTAFNAKQSAGSYVTTARNVNTNAPLTGGGSLAGDLTLSLAPATASAHGYLSSADWATFNGKDGARTTGNLTETTSSVLSISGGTGSVIGAGTTIAVTKSGSAANGYLGSGDWLAFNGKQSNLGFSPVNKAGDTMAGTLTLPANGLAVGSGQIAMAGGSVGIGTTSPMTSLHVAGAGGIFISNSDFINGSAGSGGYLSTGATSGTTYTQLQAFHAGNLAPDNLVLQRYGGNVGIGTTSPQGTLHVHRSTDVNLFVYNGLSDPSALMLSTVNDANTVQTPLEFRSSKTNFGSGAVGIGSTNPGYSLDVNGDINSNSNLRKSGTIGYLVVAAGICFNGHVNISDAHSSVTGGASCSNYCACGNAGGYASLVCPGGTTKWLTYINSAGGDGGEGGVCVK